MEGAHLLVTHSPGLDGDAAREIVRQRWRRGRGGSLEEIGVDPSAPVKKAQAHERVAGWVRAHADDRAPATLLFFGVSPEPGVRGALLEAWAAGSALEAHVGDGRESEAEALALFQAAPGPKRLTVSRGAGAAALADRWVRGREGAPALNPKVIADVEEFDATGVPNPLARFLGSGQTEVSLWEALTADAALYAALRERGEGLRRSEEAELEPLLKSISHIRAGSWVDGPPFDAYLVEGADARKASDLARRVWRRAGGDAVLLARTGPQTAALRHAPASAVTALAAAQWLAARHGAAPPGGRPDEASLVLAAAQFDSLFGGARPGPF